MEIYTVTELGPQANSGGTGAGGAFAGVSESIRQLLIPILLETDHNMECGDGKIGFRSVGSAVESSTCPY